MEKSTVTVPDLFGLEAEEAIRRIAEEGLTFNEIFTEPSTYKSGTVIDQSLEPNTEVEPGTPIDIVISEPAADDRPMIRRYRRSRRTIRRPTARIHRMYDVAF